MTTEAEAATDEPTIWVRRQWNDWRDARYRLRDLQDPHWDWTSGGVRASSAQPFVHAYVWCDGMIAGELAHSCAHGQGPHRIKVCAIRKRNEPAAFATLVALAGPKPRK